MICFYQYALSNAIWIAFNKLFKARSGARANRSYTYVDPLQISIDAAQNEKLPLHGMIVAASSSTYEQICKVSGQISHLSRSIL